MQLRQRTKRVAIRHIVLAYFEERWVSGVRCTPAKDS